jgi:ribosomal protein S2, bacterial type
LVFQKKEVLKLGKERDKLKRSLGGIAERKKVPNMLFVIDTNIESLAIKEAAKLNIPIVAVLDSNSDPEGINFPIPGNDDARRSINLYCELLKDTIVDAKKYIAKEKIEEKKPKILKEKVEVKTAKNSLEKKIKAATKK